ncbi:MAG TPA: DUF1343 domain-containing protein, partial [Phycisphaerae bacterium]|nr:DUF1343 domain-containing protein [Phycisphaerae bacterium]
ASLTDLEKGTGHGLTAGEMALLHKDWKQLALDLTVIKMEGWSRDLFFDQTGIVWTNPSPNIRRVDAAPHTARGVRKAPAAGTARLRSA